MNYQLSNASRKMSNSTYCAKFNPNILLCRCAKRARKFQIIVVLQRQILMYSNVGKLSEPINVKQYLFTKPNPNIFLCRRAKRARK